MLKEETKPYYYGLDYGSFTPYLTKALQEVIIIQRKEKTKIADLENKNNVLTSKIADLENQMYEIKQLLAAANN